MNEELKTKIGEILVALTPQIEKDFNDLQPKERIELWMSLSAMYLHETALSFMDDDDEDGEESLMISKEYN